jgi:hypothetical protein
LYAVSGDLSSWASDAERKTVRASCSASFLIWLGQTSCYANAGRYVLSLAFAFCRIAAKQ